MAHNPMWCRMLLSSHKVLNNCRNVCNVWRTKRLSKSNGYGHKFSTSSHRVLYAGNKSVSSGNKSDSDYSSELKYIDVRTCVNYWYENPPGLLFDVGYIDKNCSNDKAQPTIVGIPDLMGTHVDLMPVLDAFIKLGYRVVIPNFPGSPYAKGFRRADEGFFQYSIEEKAIFLDDFLIELGIERVDLFVTDGYGMFTAMQLCCDAFDRYKAIAMINPKGSKPTRDMEPTTIFKAVTKGWDIQFKRPMVKLHLFFWRFFSNKRNWSLTDLVLFARSTTALSFNNMQALYFQCGPVGVPLCGIYSSRDENVADIEEALGQAGLPKSVFAVYDENDNLVSTGENSDFCTGIMFSSSLENISESQQKVIKTKLFNFLKKTFPWSKQL